MNPVYAQQLTANQEMQIYFGGSSSGKSFAILGQRTIRDVMTGKRNYLVCRKVAGTIRRSCFNEIWKCITRMDLEGEFERNKSEMIITHIPTRAQILFSGLDDVEKVKSITPEKGVVTDIIVEEATEIDYDDYKQLQKRLRGDTGDDTIKRIALLFNPILQDHWIYTEFFAGIWDDSKDYYLDEKLLILRTTYKDNRWLTEDDIRKLEDETDKYYYDVYTLGKWGVLGNLIFTNWEIRDLSESYKVMHQFYNGLDFGFYPDPAAYTRSSYHRTKKEVYIFTEMSGTDLTNDLLAEKLKPIIKREVLTCDSAEPKSIQELNNFGINAVPAVKGPGSLEFGIKWLQRQKIIVDQRCIQTILELKKYKYREDRNGRVLPEPVDKDNHLIDSLRYGLESVMVETRVN
jgi:phage terminase large subunit